MKATIWRNPPCSRSRETLAILSDTPSIDIEIIEYLKHPPTRETLTTLYSRAGLTPLEALRTDEPLAEELGLANAGSDAILDAMVANPLLIERPLVETPKGVRLGRPPGRVREIL